MSGEAEGAVAVGLASSSFAAASRLSSVFASVAERADCSRAARNSSSGDIIGAGILSRCNARDKSCPRNNDGAGYSPVAQVSAAHGLGGAADLPHSPLAALVKVSRTPMVVR
jgi:hypothetical protein